MKSKARPEPCLRPESSDANGRRSSAMAKIGENDPLELKRSTEYSGVNRGCRRIQGIRVL